MVFSKPIIPIAALLLAAQLAAAGKDSRFLPGDLTFAKAPPMSPELSAWLASKPSKSGNKTGGTKTASKGPARRTVGAEPEISAFVHGVESVPGELGGSEYSVSLTQPVEAFIPTGVPAAEPTAVEDDDSFYVSSGERSTYNEDFVTEPADEEDTGLAARDPKLVPVSSSRINPWVGNDGKIIPKSRIIGEEGNIPNESVKQEQHKMGRIISKSRIVDEDASSFQDGSFQDASENDEDDSWGKRDRGSGPGGYDASGVKGEGRGPGKGARKGAGKGPGNGEGKAFADGKKFGPGAGPGMKRGVPAHGNFNGTATGRPERPGALPKGFKPGTAKPTGAAWKAWADGASSGKHGVKPTSTPSPTVTV